MNIENLTKLFSDLWKESSPNYKFTSKIYSAEAKLNVESNLSRNFERIKKVKGCTSKSAFKEMFFSEFGLALKSLCGFENNEHELVLSDEFTCASEKFISMAKSFDNTISEESIAQASRNIWVMNVIQNLFGIPVEITPAVFAYSMLYPYCDNYFDDISISDARKQIYIEKISAKLKGEITHPDEATEKVFNLLQMIEDQYPRNKYTELYKSLLAIHNAQIKSLSLLEKNKLNRNEIQSICIEKGGSSVLADGFLVAGFLNDLQQKFLFGYGVYLQLIDDLQDVEDDINSGVMTLFTYEQKRNKLDFITDKLFGFGDNLCSKYYKFDNLTLKELMFRTARLLTLECAGKLPKHYNKAYLHDLEEYSPIRFKFLKENKKKAASDISIKKMTKALMLSEAFAG